MFKSGRYDCEVGQNLETTKFLSVCIYFTNWLIHIEHINEKISSYYA